MMPERSGARLKNTSLTRRNALSTVSSGIETSTAPAVPASTIMAAVICATSRRWPPSRVNPPRIPRNAMANPANEPTSTPPLFLGAGGRVFAGETGPEADFSSGMVFYLENAAAERDHAANQFFRILQHDQLLTVGQTDQSVRRGLDVLNEIGVEPQRNVIDTCDFDHRESSSAALIGERHAGVNSTREFIAN